MASGGKRRGVTGTVTGMRYGGPVSRRDPGPWALAWLAGGATVLLGAGTMLPGGYWWPAAVALAATVAAASCARALTRADGWAARQQLLGVLRALGTVPAGGKVMVSRDAGLVLVVDVRNFRPLPWPFPWRWQKVTVTEIGMGYIASIAEAGSGHLTGRTFDLIPWEAGVRVAVRDGTHQPGGGEEAARLFFRQWFPDERTTAGMLRKEWRGRRSGSLHAPPGEARLLAGMLATAQDIDRAGDGGDQWAGGGR